MEEKLMEEVNFEEGDEVFDLACGNGYVKEIHPDYKSLPYPVKVRFESGKTAIYTLGGLYYTTNVNRSLFHGHNLEVTVKEKKPIREKPSWVFVYELMDRPAVSSAYNSADACHLSEEAYKALGYPILQSTFKLNRGVEKNGLQGWRRGY